MTAELDRAADFPGELTPPETVPAEADAPPLELGDGVSATGGGQSLEAATAEDGTFGDLAETTDPAETVTTAAEANDADLLDEPDDDQPVRQDPGVDEAREAVRAALDEQDGAAADAGNGEGDGDHPKPPTGGNGGRGGEGGETGDGEDPEDGDEPLAQSGDDQRRGVAPESSEPDVGSQESAEAAEEAEVKPGDDAITIPVQRAEEERALDELKGQTGGTSTEDVAEEANEDEAIRIRDEVHAANLDDLVHLSKISVVGISQGGGRFDNLHFELAHNHQDATEYLAELAGELRSGSTDLPRITDWRDEVTEPAELQAGQVIEVATLRDLDELLSRVGGWLNNDIRAVRDSSALDEPHAGIWQDPRPSELLGNVKDLRGKHFFGAQTNIEAMALPVMRGHVDHTRYFTVSSQLKSSGKAPEPSRPMRLVSVTALPAGYKGDKIASRFKEIGRVPASVAAWLIDSQSRDVGHDTQYDNMQHPILSGKFNRR